MQSILELVHHGLGISIVPSSVGKQYRHLDIDFIDISALMETAVVIAYQDELKNDAFDRCRSLIKETFQSGH